MVIIYDLVGRVVLAMLYAMQLLMLGRAVTSWFSQDEDSKLSRFLFAATEPFLLPIRKFLNRFEFFSSMPIDMSFMAALLILMICTTFVGSTIN